MNCDLSSFIVLIVPFAVVEAETTFSSCSCDEEVLLRSGLLKYIPNPTITDTTAIAIASAQTLSLSILIPPLLYFFFLCCACCVFFLFLTHLKFHSPG